MKVRRNKMFQILTVFLLSCISVGLFIISVNNKTPAVIKVVFDVSKERYAQCNTNVHIQVQYIYIFILTMVNAFQGIRARRLPSVFKETIFVIYLSFLNAVIICMTSVLYFNGADERNRDYIVLYTALAINFLVCFMLFGYKCVLMICQPHKNRRENTMADIRRRIKKDVASKSKT